MAHVAHDSDDGRNLIAGCVAGGDPLPDRTLTREESLGERRIHRNDARGVGAVGIAEGPSGDQGNPGHPEIFWRH